MIKYVRHQIIVINVIYYTFSFQYKQSPLLAAINRGHTETAQLFINKGADVNKCLVIIYSSEPTKVMLNCTLMCEIDKHLAAFLP